MKIERKTIKISELIKGYKDSGDEGIVGYDGNLNIRPPYQREFIYKPKERDEVIRTILKGFPINVMYWAKADDGHYELMDGQQRTISICRYVAERSFSVDYQAFHNQPEDKKQDILNYELDIYICDGKPSEVLDWFQVINIANKPLTDQELRNISYTGSWLSDAKRFFSKPQCAAYNMAGKYMNGSPIRQDYLETALRWIVDREKRQDPRINDIRAYMGKHQTDENASQLWLYFRKVIEWTEALFPDYRSEMKGIEWGILYNEYKDSEFDPAKLEQEISELMMDDDVTNKKGIYPYVFNHDERHLNIRAFTPAMKRAAYERQKGICAKCQGEFSLNEMEADHITPWSQGGKTNKENCQMLCRDCNRRKSDI